MFFINFFCLLYMLFPFITYFKNIKCRMHFHFYLFFLVPPTILSQETITYDQGGKTTVLKCYVRSYLPLSSAVWCRLLPNNECLDKKSSIVLNGRGLRTIIFETSEELESASYKCKASNIIGAVESPHVQLHEKENDGIYYLVIIMT